MGGYRSYEVLDVTPDSEACKIEMSNRKLDALYAERVLGCRLRKNPLRCDTENHIHSMHLDHNQTSGVCSGELLEFTTSLDSAWPGVEKLSGYVSISRSIDELVSLPISVVCGGYLVMGTNPALALVKACLLAVGVTQEEIDSAESVKAA